MVRLIYLLLIIAILSAFGFSLKIRGCYFTSWAQYRSDPWKYQPDDYEPCLCTHIFYAFADLKDNKIATLEWNDVDLYKKVVDLKKKQPNLKVLLSVGGATRSSNFPATAGSEANRKEFAKSTVDWLNKYGFDGVDIDWEFPTADQKDSFSALLADLRTALKANSPPLLLTAAVTANQDSVGQGADVPKINENVDFINVMTYDLHGAWDPVTGHNSPLHDKTFSIEKGMDAWVSRGLSKDKAVVGLASYGRGFKLKNAAEKGVGAGASGPASAKKYSKTPGFLTYYEASDDVDNGAERMYDSNSQNPYYAIDSDWFSYDDVESIKSKVKWTEEQGYAGAFFWTLDMDDFRAGCKSSKGKKYPLLSQMNNKGDTCSGSVVTSPPEQSATTRERTAGPPSESPGKAEATIGTMTTPSVITKPPGELRCNEAGQYLSVPGDCSKFGQCVAAGQPPVIKDCPSGLHFNLAVKVCDWPANVVCK